jgi:tripeptide aminopeptidase
MKKVTERFLEYISIDTTSVEASDTYPSSSNQLVLAEKLAQEMKEMGLSEVEIDQYGYVTGTIPANTEGAPVIGLISHMDTSDAASGKNIKARTILYEGGDIILNPEKGICISEEEFPELAGYVGQHLIVTDGTTLLGADDKAGVAEIMTASQVLLEHPEIPHGKIRIAFTPDEEIGAGTDYFNVEKFGADYAYTVDGGELGELEYENFNAASVKVVIHGRSIHPGSAKNRMVNALMLAWELQGMLPWQEQPEYTEGYEGFYHLVSMEGNVSTCTMHYLIREHDKEKYENRKQYMQRVIDYLNEKYGQGTFEGTIKDSYFNMKEIIQEHMGLVDKAMLAFQKNGVEPKVVPIRGGTDGARLSFVGLPCPNLSTGGHNFHGELEYIPCESMEKMTEVLVTLASSFVGNEK